jgi:hypothetical protein
MTNYNMVIDAISQELHAVYKQDEWNETTAKQTSHKILALVEQFQTMRAQKRPRWRASD